MVKGESVYLQLEAEGSGGLINSDWFLLKFNGYKRTNQKPGLHCDLKLQDDKSVQFENCNKEESDIIEDTFKAVDNNKIELGRNHVLKNVSRKKIILRILMHSW